MGYGLVFVNMAQNGGPPDFSVGGIPLFIGSVIMLGGFGWTIYNRWITAGRTGQSLGKRVIKISLISEANGQPIGALNAFLRDLVHILDGIAYIGYLWPLWDEKKQTFSDKIMKTIVVHRRAAAALTSSSIISRVDHRSGAVQVSWSTQF